MAPAVAAPQRNAQKSKFDQPYQTKAKITAAMSEVIAAFLSSPGRTGAPGSVPSAIAPASCWLRTPKGSTANSTVHQMMK